MAKLITVYWRDIPSQVLAKRGRDTVKVKLSARFQAAIHRAAMRAGKGGSGPYAADWRRESRACGGDLEGEARDAAAALEAGYSDERLACMIAAKGMAVPAPSQARS